MAEYTVRLKDLYRSEVAPALQKKFQYQSPMQIPKLDKVVLNVGCGDARENSKAIDSVIADLTLITGQKAVPTYARKSVANFKAREGMKIGAKVTLRGDRMYEFVDRLFNFALPAYATSRASTPTLSTAEETTPSDSRSSSYSPRSNTTRSIRSAVWISAS